MKKFFICIGLVMMFCFGFLWAKSVFADDCIKHDIHLDNVPETNRYYMKLIGVKDGEMETVGSRIGEINIKEYFMFYLYHKDNKLIVWFEFGDNVIHEEFNLKEENDAEER